MVSNPKPQSTRYYHGFVLLEALTFLADEDALLGVEMTRSMIRETMAHIHKGMDYRGIPKNINPVHYVNKSIYAKFLLVAPSARNTMQNRMMGIRCSLR